MFKILMSTIANMTILLAGGSSVSGKSAELKFPADAPSVQDKRGMPGRVQFNPIGNDAETLGAFVFQDETRATDQREFLGSFGLVVDAGTAPRDLSGKADKVAVYAAIDCKTSGGGACWSQNLLVEVRPGYAASGAYGATDTEMDFNNNDIATGETDGAEGLAAPGYAPVTITGVGSKRSTAALIISGPGDHTLFNRGLVFANNSIQQSSIADYGVSAISVDIRGQHATGVDTHLMKGGANFLAANGNGLFFENVAGTGAFQGIVGGGDGAVRLGFGSTVIYAMQDLAPGIEPASLGTASKVWHEAHIATVHAGSYVETLRTPASSSAPCAAGEFTDDSKFHYVCVAANHWKRVALGDF